MSHNGLMTTMSSRWATDISASDATLRRFLHGLPGVDDVGARARAATLASRSIKTDSKRQAIDLAISMIDLTTLEGQDTPGKVRALCAKARQPGFGAPPVAAVCVYPDLVPTAVTTLAGTPVHVASVATSFPSGRAALEVKLADVKSAVAAGADEVDMVIDRGAFLSGRYLQVFEEIGAVKASCGDAHLKVILETGELGTFDNVRRASWLAMLAGADFIKTSTGKVTPAATLPVTLVMLEAVREACGPTHLKVILETAELATLDNTLRAAWLAMLAGADFIKTSTGKVTPAATPPVALVMLSAVRDFAEATGRRVGVKVAGGIRTAKDAIRYLVLVREIAGPQWLTPEAFRIGASSLLNDLLMQRRKQITGAYAGPDYFTLD